MILYGFLIICLYVLEILAGIFGTLIPDFPDSLNSIFTNLISMINGGLSFLSYFLNMGLVTALISLVIAYYGFAVVKDAVMKVVGFFIAN